MNKTICDICGGTLVYEDELYKCAHCGAVYDIKADSNEESTLLVVAFEKLRQTRFDEADEEFTDIISKYSGSYEAYWGKLLAKYGVIFVDDIDGKKVPTCFDLIESVTSDALYKCALTLAPPKVAATYRMLAEKIEVVRAEWAKKASKEPPYDIFLCYKESDVANGIERTADSYEVNNLYTYLSKKGYRVFFSRESLRDKIAEKYEPYIFGAIQSAPIMIVYGSNREYFESTWVRNEWMRFIKRIENGEKPSNGLVVAYENMNAYDLPPRLKSRQCIDASQKTFYPDLLEHIERVLSPNASNTTSEVKTNDAPGANPDNASAASPKAKKNRINLPRRPKRPPLSSRKVSLIRNLVAFAAAAITIILSIISFTVSNGTNNGRPQLQACLATLSLMMLFTAIPIAMFYSFRLINRFIEMNNNNAIIHSNKAGSIASLVVLAATVTLIIISYVLYFNSFISAGEITFKSRPIDDGNGIQITSVDAGDHRNIVIPERINNKQVVSIAPNVFKDCKSIISITIPNTVTSIGESAFSGCTGLVNVTIPHQLKSIGKLLFNDCSKLTGISLPMSVESVGDSAFSGCSALDNIYIPTAKTIGEYVLSGCIGLKSISLPYVGDANYNPENTHFGYLFGASSYTTQSKIIPSNLTEVKIRSDNPIGDYAFYGCSGLTSITFPEVASIGDSAFEGCSRLTSAGFATNLTVIGNRAFADCRGLTSVTFPELTADNKSLASIGESAFKDCKGLTNITVTGVVNAIGKGAFSGCDYLTSISLPFVGESLNGKANTYFGYVFGAADAESQNEAIPSKLNEVSITDSTSIGNQAFYRCEKISSVTLSDTITDIGEYAFYDCRISNIDLPNSIKTVANGVFKDCSLLTSITIPNGVTSIGEYAFYACNNLQEVSIPDSVTFIGNYAFYRCSILEEVSIPDSVTSIAKGVFKDCSLLTSITIPNGVTSIGEGAFLGCNRLKTVSIPDSVTSIGNNAFFGCDYLKDCPLPDSVTYIGEGAFYDCYDLKDCPLPNRLISIGNSAFYNCGFVSLTIPDSLTYIGESAFRNNPLESITLPFLGESPQSERNTHFGYIFGASDAQAQNSYIPSKLAEVTITTSSSISDYAFYGCANITNVTLPQTVTSIGKYAFSGCANLTSIIIPENLKTIDSSAFFSCPRLGAVYYTGVEAAWNELSIGTGNNKLNTASRYYYSESAIYDGKHWHYSQGKPAIWSRGE